MGDKSGLRAALVEALRPVPVADPAIDWIHAVSADGALRTAGTPGVGVAALGRGAVASDGSSSYARAGAHGGATQGGNGAGRGARRGEERSGRPDKQGHRDDGQKRG